MQPRICNHHADFHKHPASESANRKSSQGDEHIHIGHGKESIKKQAGRACGTQIYTDNQNERDRERESEREKWVRKR